MQITEVRIKLMDEPGERLKAFCSITFDNCFVVRDLKIIEGVSGPFVAMPSRKLTSHCSRCGMKNHLRANYCNQCGSRLAEARPIKDADGRAKLYADIAHPINSTCREMIQEHVVSEYYEELERAKQPGYVSRYDDFDAGDYYVPAAGDTTATTHRVDAPHARNTTAAPHSPPQGDPTSRGASGPHTRPSKPSHTRASKEASHSSEAGRSDIDEQGLGGFGAGIF